MNVSFVKTMNYEQLTMNNPNKNKPNLSLPKGEQTQFQRQKRMPTAEKWCNKSTAMFIIINIEHNYFSIRPLHLLKKCGQTSNVAFSQHRTPTCIRVVVGGIRTKLKSVISNCVGSFFVGVRGEISQ